MAADHRLVPALDVQEVSFSLEDLVRYSMEASPQVEPKALANSPRPHQCRRPTGAAGHLLRNRADGHYGYFHRTLNQTEDEARPLNDTRDHTMSADKMVGVPG